MAIENAGIPNDKPIIEHNAAMDSSLTSGVARMWNALAQPLVEHVYGPLGERNHALGVVMLNATLTAPRVAEVPLANRYVDHVENGRMWRARGILAVKALLKSSDGIDGAAARGAHLTSKFGTGFDPGVDLIGSASDVWAIKQLAKGDDDELVDNLMDVGTAIDVAAILIGGVGGALSAAYAERNGVELAPEEEAKAISTAKAKYAAKGAGNELLEYGKTVKNPVAKKLLRASGISLNLTADVFGVVSLFQYGRMAVSRIHKVRELKKAVAASV